MAEEKVYSAADEGDCEAVGDDFRADVDDGCMNVNGNEFLKFKIPNGVKKDADIKIMAEDVSYFFLICLFIFLFFSHLTNLSIQLQGSKFIFVQLHYIFTIEFVKLLIVGF